MNKRESRILFWLAVVLLMLVPQLVSGYAIGSGYGIVGVGQIIELFDGMVELRLEDGWEFLDNRAYYRWSIENMDLGIELVEEVYQPFRSNDETLIQDTAFIWPAQNTNKGWMAQIVYVRSGHLEPVQEIDKKRMLKSYYWDAEFFGEPEYADDKRKLTWQLKFASPGEEPWLKYEGIIYMREGYMSIMLNLSEKEMAAGLAERIEDAFTITNGNRYDDFSPDADQVAVSRINDDIVYKDFYQKKQRASFYMGLAVFALLGIIAILAYAPRNMFFRRRKG